MRKRVWRFLGVLILGGSLQVFGCQSEEIGQLLADTVNQTAVGVSSILVSGAIDGALGIAP